MDREMARMMDAELRESPYDSGLTLDSHREFCRILGILSEADLQRIMMAGVPHLSVRARQLEGLTLLTLYRSQFHIMSEEGFLEEAEQFRAAMRLPPLERADF